MKKFTVVAQVRFDIYDENEFLATRQARVTVQKLIGKEPDPALMYEYPQLETPYVFADDFKILDENGKTVLNRLANQDGSLEEPEANQDGRKERTRTAE